jgi:hypothetical protein
VRRCEKPVFEPYMCAATLRGEDRDGWIDTGLQLRGFDPHVYLSFAAVKTAALIVGWEDPAPLKDRIAELERENADLAEQLASADQELNAIHILKGRGYAAAKRPGRPPTKQAA